MKLPKLMQHTVKQKVTDSFRGINTRKMCAEDQFSDTENLSSRHFPALATAPEVYELEKTEGKNVVTPLFFLNKGIGYVTSSRADAPEICRLIYKGSAVTNFFFKNGWCGANAVNFNAKTFLAHKNTVYEFDPEFSNPRTALSKAGYEVEISAAHDSALTNEPTLCLSLMYEDRTEISKATVGVDFPEDAEVGDCFIKMLECYRLIAKGSDSSSNVWQPVTSVRLRLELGEGYREFKKGDYIRLNGLKFWNWSVRSLKELDRFVRIDSVDSEGRYITEALPLFENYSFILEQRKYPTNDLPLYNDPIIDNPGNKLYMLEGSISACMPEIDLMCTGANRIWACNSEKREIYASELGSARNWSVFEGLSSDSYAVTVGSPGDFTACCNYGGSPVFFKENEMIIIRGSRPSSFTLNSYSVRGVPRHSPDGLCVVGDILYYLSHDGVYAYDGSGTVCVSQDVNSDIKRMTNAVFGGEGDLLYISGSIDAENIRYSYDTVNRIWHKCRCDRVIGFLRYPDATLQVSYDGDLCTVSTLGNGIPEEYELTGAKRTDMPWYWESGDISLGSCDKKYVRRISLDTVCNGSSQLLISYDGGEFVSAGRFEFHDRKCRRVYVFPRRCDYFRLRMEGNGEMILYNITKDVEEAKENG